MRLIPTYMGNSLYRVENWRTRAVNPHVHGELGGAFRWREVPLG